MEFKMNTIQVTTSEGIQIGHLTNSNNNAYTSGMMSDDISEPSSPESSFDANDLYSNAVNDDVTAQLAAAGPIGVAAAAAIASARKRKHPHHFETNPSKRKRQQTRLLRKLKATIEEYTTRVGQQAIVLCCTPGKMSQSVHAYKVFGSQPLESVIRNNKPMILQDLETSLAEQAPPSQADNSGLHELPPLVIDGIPTPVDKMTQAQLRNFIPEMLKYSTGRSKPGWGKEECRPPWWPSDLPWANVRSDARTDEDKKRVSWTEALRTIVKNCYKHHGRDDLLHVFQDDNQSSANQTHHVHHQPQNFGGTMVQTINNPDGTVSIIQIDAAPQSIVTLPDGTQATVVQCINTPQHEATQAVQTLAESSSNQNTDMSQSFNSQIGTVSLDMGGDNPSQMAALPINQNGQIVFTNDGQIGGIVTIPVSMYQSMTGTLTAIDPSQLSHSTPQLTQQQIQHIQQQLQPHLAQHLGQITMVSAPSETSPMDIKPQTSSVPDATQAVEVMTVDQPQ
ncbi:DNA-binding protein P3A2-like [Mytilus galloprovincialis]|uniref:Nuclear respiratory factor 1 n=3 Tax=Mytilus TaxID=6548 RepID=A0A8B6C3K1_MYTGA|nr:nuclear respiratory factor 1 [Mytilus galloprovincialis]